MCSNAINKALKTLDFVQSVNADIKTYMFEVLFKSNAHVDVDMIREKVEKASFTVTGFVATIQFNNVQITQDQPVSVDNNSLMFVNMNKLSLDGLMHITCVRPKTFSRVKYLLIVVVVILSLPCKGQELYSATEPASNIVAGAIGFSIDNSMMNEINSTRVNYHLIPTVMVGLSKKLMLQGNVFFSNRSGFHECWQDATSLKDEKFDNKPLILDIWDYRRKDVLIKSGMYFMEQITRIELEGSSGKKQKLTCFLHIVARSKI